MPRDLLTIVRGGEVQFRVLGGLDVDVGGQSVTLGSHQLRAILAALLVDANTPVASDRLADVLWGDDPPSNARSSLSKLVYRLRAALPPPARAAITTTPSGYVLRVDGGDYDAARFEALLSEAQRSLQEARVTEAAETLDAALALWRGPAFAEFMDDELARAESVRLDELHVAVLEARAETMLRLGRHDAAVSELETLIAAHPYREQLWGQLMLAYHRSGRQADALHAYQELRRRLADELGIEPSRSLRELEGAILRNDPELATRDRERAADASAPADSDAAIPKPDPPRQPARARHRRALAVVLGMALLASAGTTLALVAGDDDDDRPALAAPTVTRDEFRVRYQEQRTETWTNTSTGSDFQGVAKGTVINGSYTGRSLGKSTAPPPLCGDGPGAQTLTSIVLTAPNGDVLRRTSTGWLCQSAPLALEFAGTYTVRGGTGCFTDARGTGKTSAHIVLNPDFRTGLSAGVSDGSIILTRRPGCPGPEGY